MRIALHARDPGSAICTSRAAPSSARSRASPRARAAQLERPPRPAAPMRSDGFSARAGVLIDHRDRVARVARAAPRRRSASTSRPAIEIAPPRDAAVAREIAHDRRARRSTCRSPTRRRARRPRRAAIAKRDACARPRDRARARGRRRRGRASSSAGAGRDVEALIARAPAARRRRSG